MDRTSALSTPRVVAQVAERNLRTPPSLLNAQEQIEQADREFNASVCVGLSVFSDPDHMFQRSLAGEHLSINEEHNVL